MFYDCCMYAGKLKHTGITAYVSFTFVYVAAATKVSYGIFVLICTS